MPDQQIDKKVELDIKAANAQLRDQSPAQIIRWALALGQPTIASTSFGPNSGALLHLLAGVDPAVPVVWVDSGYNMRDTYVVADQLIAQLNLNAQIFVPAVTAERLNAQFGGIPTPDEAARHAEFTRIVKLDPFARALRRLRPKVWINGIRREDTEFRQSLDILSHDQRGILKVAPIFYWTDAQLEDYMQQHNLPSCRHYFDPTKVDSGRECGLHTAA